MNYYQDFDQEDDLNDNEQKKKNTFVFEGFNDRLKKIKVRLSNNYANDLSFLKIEKEENFTMLDNDSNFVTMLTREKVLNASPEFIQFVSEIKPFTKSYLILINNSHKLISILAETLDKHLNIKLDVESDSGETLNKINENPLNQRNYPFIISVLEVMTGFIKDIREDAAEIFLNAILPNLVKLLCNSSNTMVIDKTFSVFVNIFKFLNKAITKNFKKFFLTLSELIFNKNKLIRKFSSESVCFLFKNMEKNELGKCLSAIYEVFVRPEMIFNMEEPSKGEIKEELTDIVMQSEINFNDLFNDLKNSPYKSSTEFLKSLLVRSNTIDNKSEKIKLYLFLIDCVSDLFCEILIGMNKNLSVRADLLLENMIECFDDDNMNLEEKDCNFVDHKEREYLAYISHIIIIDTLMKLFHILSPNNKKNSITLFNFFIYLIENRRDNKLSFPKLNLDNLTSQLNKCIREDVSEKTQIYCLIYIREMVLKNYNKLNSQTVTYFIELYDRLISNINKESVNASTVRSLFASEIFSIFVKFYPKEITSFYKLSDSKKSYTGDSDNSKILKVFSIILTNTVEENSLVVSLSLNNFLKNLKSLQKFETMIEMIFLNKKKLFTKNINTHNEEYELNFSSYENEVLVFIFEMALNQFKFTNSSQILDTVTTFQFLSLNNNVINEEANSKYHTNLNFVNNYNKEIVVEDLKTFVGISENNKVRFELANFVQMYSKIILCSLLQENEFMQLTNFSKSIFDYLIDSLQIDQNEEKFVKLSDDLEEKKLFSILLNEFNSDGVYFISKKEAVLILLENFININESFSNHGSLTETQIKKMFNIIFSDNQKENLSIGIVYKIFNKILNNNFESNPEEFILNYKLEKSLKDMTGFISEHSVLLLSHNNEYKIEYLDFIFKIYFTTATNDAVVSEIFEIMKNILELRVEQKNEKKFAFDIEMLMSKLESLLSRNVLKGDLTRNLILTTYNFLLGGYYIRYTKSVWSVITKSVEKLNSIVNSSNLFEVKLNFNNTIKQIISFIRSAGNSDDFITRYGVKGKLIESNYLTFNVGNSLYKDQIYTDNIVSFNFLLKQDELKTITLFYEGFLQSLQGCHNLYECSTKQNQDDEDLVLEFLHFLIENLNYYCSEQNNWLDQLIIDQSDAAGKSIAAECESTNFILCIFNNYVNDKEHKTGPLHKKLVEALFMILSRINFSKISKSVLSTSNIQKILYQSIITSKSLKIQKFCVEILIMLDDRLKSYRKLLDAVIENTNVIDRLYNIDKIVNDNGLEMKPEERKAVIPIITRLYYSKYFYVANENKKMRTKNKINLVSFFIQLNRKEFIEYTRIIFEPIAVLFKSDLSCDFDFDLILFGSDINALDAEIEKRFSSFNYNIKTFRKVIDILILNIKQITNLFQDSIYFVSILLKKILVFIKNLNHFIKRNMKSDTSEFSQLFESTLRSTNVHKTKYLNYYNDEGILQYMKYFTKNIKEIKKQIFGLLKNIFYKFYKKPELIDAITSEICREYVYVFEGIRDLATVNAANSFKLNSILNFFMSFARNPQLHFIYINNAYMFSSILEIYKHKRIDNNTLKSLLDFVDLILSPYHNLKIKTAREEYIKTWKENCVIGKLGQDEKKEEADIEMNDAKEENISLNEENSVIIEELNVEEYDDDKQFIKTNEIDELSEEMARYNEENLIIKNFGVFNENLLFLVKNKRVKYTVKDWNTRKLIEIFVYLWNMNQSSFTNDSISQSSSAELLSFLLTILRSDCKINKYKNRDTLCDILKVCHILVLTNKSDIRRYFKDFMSLIYKISEEDSNNRLILTILLQEFDDYYSSDIAEKSKFKEILLMISNLNLSSKGVKAIAKNNLLRNLDNYGGNSGLDVDNTLDRVNLIDENFCGKLQLYHLEPLIYQLLVFSKNADYSLQTISLSKIKLIFEIYQKYSNNNLANLLGDDNTMTDEQSPLKEMTFNKLSLDAMLSAFYELLEGGQKIKSNSNANLARTLLEIMSHINSLIFNEDNAITYTEKKYEIICSDLFYIKLKNYDYNFLEGILNLKYDIRSEALQSLKQKLETNSISYFSLINVIVPITKTFLTANTFIKSNSYSNEKQIQNIISETNECIPGICKSLNSKDLKDFLFFFFNQIGRTNKKSSENEKDAKVEGIITRMLYKGLTKLIETVTKIIKSKFEFAEEFIKNSNELMEEHIEGSKEKYDKTGMAIKNPEVNIHNIPTLNYNKEHFKRLFEKLSQIYHSKVKYSSNSDIISKSSFASENTDPSQSSDILFFIKTKIYKTLKTIVIDSAKKEKNSQYYIRNYAIRPYIEVIKFLDPHQIKYELIQLNYEIINNLKNRDLEAREKAREAIKIVFESLGCQIAPMIFDELQTQLNSGYQRYIMGYTCNYMINLINNNYEENNARLVFDFSSNLIMPILLDELFGDVAEEMEIEELIKKYKEAKQTKAFNSFFVLSSKIHLHNAIVDLVYPLRSYLLKKDNDAGTVNKANEVINHIIKGFKNNPTLNFDEILNFAYGLIINGLEINLKNSKEIKENKKMTIKGGDISDPKLKKRSYLQQVNETYTIQIGAMNGKNYSMEISEKLIDNKNEIVLSNLFTSLGLDLFHVSLKKKMFDIKSINSEDNTEIGERLSLILNQIVICLKISNNNILSKSLKILTKLFDGKLFVIKKNLKKIVSCLFKNLNMINSQDLNIAQAILSSIGEILTRFKFYEITDNQLNVLISFLKLNIHSSQIKLYVFSCLFSLVKRRILHPSIYDMIKYIQEVYLTAFEENTITLCQNIIIEFLTSYPLEHAALLSHINYYVINLESPTRKCVINSLKILYKFFDISEDSAGNNGENKASIKPKLDSVVDFVFIKLLTLITNTEDADIKSHLYANIDIVIDYLGKKDRTKLENYISKIIGWMQDENTDRSMIKLSLNFLSILLSKQRDSVEKKADLLKDLIINRIAMEFESFENDLDEKIENEQFESFNNHSKKNKEISSIFDNQDSNQYDTKTVDNFHKEDVTVLKVETKNWDLMYLSLVTLEKFIQNYYSYISNTLKSSKPFQHLIIKCLKHPHMFIKSITSRLTASILNELGNTKAFSIFIADDGDTFKPVEFLFTNFRFLMLNTDTSDKVITQTISNCVSLIKNSLKSDSSLDALYDQSCYEYLCRLYIESKSYLTNKDVSRKIFNRIYDLFEGLISQLSESQMKFYLDPILSLSYRISENKLVENSLKNRVNKLLENLSQSVNSEFFSKKYKDIRDDINLLRRKRKIKMLENSIANPKQYLDKKKNKKKSGNKVIKKDK